MDLDNNIIMEHEEEFLKDNIENGRFILSIGSKGGGKSYTLLGFLKLMIQNNIYKYIHFVCPCFSGEQNNQYDFLKNQHQVFIYKSYDNRINKIVDKDRKKGKTLYIVDDASGELLQKIQQEFIQLITTTRHFESLTVYICVHSCRRILVPIVRQNIDHLFIYRIINSKLLMDLYEEFFSMMFDNFKLFKQFYLNNTNEKNACIHFSLHTDGIDIKCKNWSFVEDQNDIVLKTHKANTANKPKPKNNEPYKQRPLDIRFGKLRLK
jgi:hypothetical protein